MEALQVMLKSVLLHMVLFMMATCFRGSCSSHRDCIKTAGHTVLLCTGTLLDFIAGRAMRESEQTIGETKEGCERRIRREILERWVRRQNVPSAYSYWLFEQIYSEYNEHFLTRNTSKLGFNVVPVKSPFNERYYTISTSKLAWFSSLCV